MIPLLGFSIGQTGERGGEVRVTDYNFTSKQGPHSQKLLRLLGTRVRADVVAEGGYTLKLKDASFTMYSYRSDDAKGVIIESWTLIPAEKKRNTEQARAQRERLAVPRARRRSTARSRPGAHSSPETSRLEATPRTPGG